jgi:hypothetical protein
VDFYPRHLNFSFNSRMCWDRRSSRRSQGATYSFGSSTGGALLCRILGHGSLKEEEVIIEWVGKGRCKSARRRRCTGRIEPKSCDFVDSSGIDRINNDTRPQIHMTLWTFGIDRKSTMTRASTTSNHVMLVVDARVIVEN